MSYKVTFLDNEQYEAVDINNAISKIMTGGVAEVFFDGQSYNTSDLNKISQFIATYGVNPENNTTLKVIKEGTTSVKILAGTAFMNSGATITITGYEILPFVAGVKNYVYLKHDASLDSVKPYCTIIAGVGDIVPLAEVEVAGTVTDKRVYCKGKLAGYQSDFARSLVLPFTDIMGQNQTLTKTIDIGANEYTRIKVESKTISTYIFAFGVYDFAANCCVGGFRTSQNNGWSYAGTGMTLKASNGYAGSVSFTKSGNIISLRFDTGWGIGLWLSDYIFECY